MLMLKRSRRRVDVDATAGEVQLVIHWQGGIHTEMRIRRRRRGESRQAAPSETVQAVRDLALICNDTMIAGYLTRNGLRTGKGNRWTRERVVSLRSKRQISVYSPQRRLSEGWMTLGEAASHAGVGERALRSAAERGEIPVKHPLDNGPWIFKRSDLDNKASRAVIERLQARKRGGAVHAPGQLSLLDSST
jgi:hypothetical protein